MALKKPATTVTTAPFEDDLDVGVDVAQEHAAQAAAVQTAPAPAPAPDGAAAASAAASTAIATSRASAAVAVSTSAQAAEFQKELQEMHGAADFSYGNYRVFKASNGEIREMGNGKNLSFGRWVEVRMLAWDNSFQVSPGTDGVKSKEFVAYSKDGKVIDHVIGEDQRQYVGKPVDAYITYLREAEGFDRASLSRYIDIACAVTATESGKHEPGDVVQIVLSQSSIPAFSSYQEKLANTARAAKMGLPGFNLPADPFRFRFVAENASRGSQNWTKLSIEPAKA